MSIICIKKKKKCLLQINNSYITYYLRNTKINEEKNYNYQKLLFKKVILQNPIIFYNSTCVCYLEEEGHSGRPGEVGERSAGAPGSGGCSAGGPGSHPRQTT